MTALTDLIKHPDMLELYRDMDNRLFKMLGGDPPPAE